MEYFGFFPEKQIQKNKGKLLMLDIDFGRFCSLNCPACFRKRNVIDDTLKGDLTYDELISVIDEARELGLQSIKICGAGEPTQNSNFLKFLQDMTERNIGVAVFTKGQVLGNDEEAKKFYRAYGIKSAQELCNELSKLKVSFMLSFQSFDTDKQDGLVGNIKNHSFVRNQALINLVNAGFTKSNPTRLALELGPITKENYDEIFDLYVYARRRNIYLIPNFLMTSGKQIDKEFLKRYDLSEKQKYDLFIKIYSWNIENGIQTIEQIKREGISCMPGIHPCNQIACGLYVTANGNVVGCPGFTEIEGNVKKEKLKDIWERSQNYKVRKGIFNCKCPPKDDVVIPCSLYQKVLDKL
ncbi:MAG: radical SAM protein [Patescibacteria group bacterium]|nr:radical SAM protein [Patescibacteria group bacterium]MDD5490985.1 radical SAM protein [Patescibacteria group bacterium]